MHLSDEESDYSTFSEENEEMSDEESPPKRKLARNSPKQLKKIKYEDITSQKKKSKNDLYKPPTVEELNELKETQNLYNNNLFRLQIEELIKEVKIKNKHRETFARWFDSFQKLLDELPEHTLKLSDLKHRKKIRNKSDEFINSIVNASVKCDHDVDLRLSKPESFEFFGLDAVNASVGPNLTIRINLKIPRMCFNVKDYLNNRYFVKRYYYLAYIGFYLKQEFEWVPHSDNPLLPTLQIKLNNKVTVRIYATPPENYFKLSRFGSCNNLKMDPFGAETVTDAPTIFYNASLAHDVTLSSNCQFFKTLGDLPNVVEAVKLIYVWVTQRGLNSSLTDELILYFVGYLVAKRKINKHMSSYQVVRNFWNVVKETDLTLNGLSLSEDSKSDAFEDFDLVFLDTTGAYNVTAFLNVDVYKKIKRECAIAFSLLDDEGINSFHNLFMTKVPTELQYDVVLNFKSDDGFEKIREKMSDDDRTKYLGRSQLFVVRYIGDVLKKGFNKRASLIVPFYQEKKISFGINLDPSQAFNILERGPALNDPKEAEFKHFWEELATDRRFKDGSVCVAVYFKTSTVKDRRHIVKLIADFVATRKLNLKYDLHYNELEEFLVDKKVTAGYPLGTNEEASFKVIQAGDELAKKLRGLDTPLSITGVQGISSFFSVTEVFPPISSNYRSGGKVTSVKENNIVMNEKKSGVVPRLVKPAECVLQLEHSSKWPRDLATLRNMKTAFYLEISKLLSQKHKIVSSVRPSGIDVLFQGFVFRYTLYLQKEVALLKESTNSGVATYKDTPQSLETELRLHTLPKVVGALKGLQSQHPSFGPASALIKRWMRAQLLDHFLFPDDVIDLLCASLYLNQSAFEIPNAPQIAFLRFLKFMAELQEDIQSVLVNFNEEISKETVAEIDSKLLQNRGAFPTLFIATPYDNCESLFTKAAPSKEVLNRVKRLAGETLSHFIRIINGESLISARGLFIPNLGGYDVLIHLRPLLNPLRHEQVVGDELEGQVVFKEFNSEESTKVPVTGFNPVQIYLKELRGGYGEFAYFFHDSYGGNVIGVLWIPKAVESRDFKVSNVGGRKLNDGKLVLNVDALIEDFYILGKGLVKSIDKK